MDGVHAHGLLRRVAVGLVAGITATVGVGLALASLPAGAATVHRAAIVVEVDGVIHTAKVTFSADSISGLDALRSAGFDPVVRVFGGNGGAVCALRVGTATIGCPADNTCLTCDPHSAYWGYWRALAGATSYTYSPVGAGNTQVHDGDVEAWAWGTGSPPSPFVSFIDVWGTDVTTTTGSPVTHPSTTRPPVSTPLTVAGLGVTTTTVVGDTATSTTVASGKVSTTTRAPRGPTTTEPPTTGVRAAGSNTKERRLAVAPVVATGGGGSPFGIIAFAVILAALVGAIVFARRRRSAAPAR